MALLRRLLPLLCALLAGSALAAAPLPPLTVHFFDVGQGDAALIVSPAGKTVLIDGGPPEAGRALAARVRTLVKGPLDLVILTHPHLDHLGGIPAVLRAVGARRFMDPGFDHPSRAYAQLLAEVGERVGQVLTPVPDPGRPDALVQVGLGEGASLSILWPRAPVQPFLTRTRSDANSNSLIVRLSYGSTAMLFAADAEEVTEERLLANGHPLGASVLKVAHHGGSYSSSAPFLAAVRPQYAVVSCGAGNDYGHPAPATLERLAAVGAQVLRTDLQGELKAVSDGTRVTVTAQRGAPALRPARKARYVALRGSPVFHREDCPALKRASTKERTLYTTREAAARDHRPAKDCNP